MGLIESSSGLGQSDAADEAAHESRLATGRSSRVTASSEVRKGQKTTMTGTREDTELIHDNIEPRELPRDSRGLLVASRGIVSR